MTRELHFLEIPWFGGPIRIARVIEREESPPPRPARASSPGRPGLTATRPVLTVPGIVVPFRKSA